VLNRLSLAGPASFSFAEAVRTLAAFPRRYTGLWLLGFNEDIVRAARLAEAHGVSAPSSTTRWARARSPTGRTRRRRRVSRASSTAPRARRRWCCGGPTRYAGPGDGAGAARALREGTDRLPPASATRSAAFPDAAGRAA
jgi:hypothetical protein